MSKKKDKLEEYIHGNIKAQAFEILTGKIDNFNFRKIQALCRKYFLKYDSLKFDRVVQYHYNNEKRRYLKQISRIKNNKKIIELQKRYELTDVIKLTTYLLFNNKMTIQRQADFDFLENIIKINLSLPLYDRTNKLNGEIVDIDKYLEMKSKSEQIKKQIKQNKEEIEQ